MGQGMVRLVDKVGLSGEAETVGRTEIVGEEGFVDEMGPDDEG